MFCNPIILPFLGYTPPNVSWLNHTLVLLQMQQVIIYLIEHFTLSAHVLLFYYLLEII